MSQNRKPPAYQEYAATILADKNFRLMTLAERGLLFSMRLECWQNGEVPSNEIELAKYLGYESPEINTSLTPRVKSFFTQNDNNFHSPELEDYRQHLVERKTKQSEGGKRGAAIVNGKTNKLRKRANNHDSAKLSGNSQVAHRDDCESLVKASTVKQNQNQSLVTGVNDPWIVDYNKNEYLANNEYSLAKG